MLQLQVTFKFNKKEYEEDNINNVKNNDRRSETIIKDYQVQMNIIKQVHPVLWKKKVIIIRRLKTLFTGYTQIQTTRSQKRIKPYDSIWNYLNNKIDIKR